MTTRLTGGRNQIGTGLVLRGGVSSDDPSKRAGDATLGRIRQLADGWAVPATPAPEAAGPTAPRPTPSTNPPPVPATPPPRPTPGTSPPPARAKPTTSPPPTPRPKPSSSPPPAPARARPSSSPPPRPHTASSPPSLAPAPVAPPRPVADRAQPGLATVQGVAAPLRATSPAAWPRRPGPLGDVRYVGTVLTGRMRARRVLARLGAADARARIERRQRLIAMARAAIGRDDLDVPAIDIAREQLANLEDGRSRSAGASAAADTAQHEVARRLADAEARSTARIGELERALAELVGEMAPVEKAQAEARARGAKLAEELAEIDRRIRDLDARATSLKHGDADRAAAAAERATARADRDAVARDEPAIKARLDELAPIVEQMLARRANLEAGLAGERGDLATARAKAAADLAAIGAQRDAAEAARGDAEAARDEALLRLGNALALARPVALAADLAPLDALARDSEARGVAAAEQGDLLASTSRAAVARGVGYLVLLAAAIGAGLWFALR